MFVVRLTFPDRDPDVKVFEHLADARRRYTVASLKIPDDISSAVLFRVDETDARAAVKAVQEGRALIIERDRHAEFQKAMDDLVEQWIADGDFLKHA